MVKREDILKFLKALDEHNVQNRDFDGDVVPGKSVELRKEYCAAYLEMFADLDIQIWETTARLVIDRKKPWPTLCEMINYVSIVENAYKEKQEALSAMEPVQPAEDQPKEVVDSEPKSKKERFQRMFELAKEGKYKEASEIVGDGFSKKVKEYTKLVYPDADEQWCEANYSALRNLTSQQEICNHCGGVGSCRTKGYRQSGEINKRTGMLDVVMKPCMVRKVEGAENVSL